MTGNSSSSTRPVIRLGVSSCLLGEAVRYDGRDKRDAYICDTLGRHFQLVPFCPEVAVGMGVPRPPVQLVQMDNDIRAVGVENPSLDVTDALRGYADKVSEEYADLSGYVFKNNSPSCGSQRVSVFASAGLLHQNGRGVYADSLMHTLPLMPITGEDGLEDPAIRWNFIERVMVYSRWQNLHRQGLTLSALETFHSRHILDFMFRDEPGLEELKTILAATNADNLPTQSDRYIQRGMQLLQNVAGPDGYRNWHREIMFYILGQIEGQIEKEESEKLNHAIDDFVNGKLPRYAVLELLRSAVKDCCHNELGQSFYLYPQAGEPIHLEE